MPIYEYECLSCGERFELRRGLTDSDSEIRCTKCETPPCSTEGVCRRR